MRSLILFSLAALLAAAAGSYAADVAVEAKQNVPPEGFQRLFNGTDLTGWHGSLSPTRIPKLKADELEKERKTATDLAKEVWSVKDGVLMMKPKVVNGKKSGVNLATVKDFRNFELLVDWKIEKAGDSGIYLRGQPQVQIWDSDNLAPSLKADAGLGSGGLWNNPKEKGGKQPLVRADKPVGEWNTFRIVMKDDKVTIHLNGKKVVEDAPLLNIWEPKNAVQKKGPIELQYHGDPLYFRNVFVKELPD